MATQSRGMLESLRAQMARILLDLGHLQMMAIDVMLQIDALREGSVAMRTGMRSYPGMGELMSGQDLLLDEALAALLAAKGLLFGMHVHVSSQGTIAGEDDMTLRTLKVSALLVHLQMTFQGGFCRENDGATVTLERL